MKRIGIEIPPHIGIGDGVQFTSLPENYFRATGQKLIDVSKPWFFDYNPYVERDVTPDEVVDLWNFPRKWDWPRPNHIPVYRSNAEIWASKLGVPVVLNRPRLYRFETDVSRGDYILFHPFGKSNGALPDYIIDHVLKKYRGYPLYQIGKPEDPNIGIPRIATSTFWSLAHCCAGARMFLGVDSGPSWIAACYPDVFIKKVRVRERQGYGLMKDWVPLDIDNHHTHWEDRMFQIMNTTEDDQGYTYSYKRL